MSARSGHRHLLVSKQQFQFFFQVDIFFRGGASVLKRSSISFKSSCTKMGIRIYYGMDVISRCLAVSFTNHVTKEPEELS